ncbi:hypothetical protein [Segnochrobactrum spirostomi]|uniref:Uncharacterized protein n=1 Tax=Segnochrobactrum spirostomi TaxID=2608987 RepID=A0A6A7Y074_9HYPH|nr:hypothetical protein [Segnochrobactrum spirostomi]MQT12253.1 hypothetical protein [Segnochrobactrum spirostomi]
MLKASKILALGAGFALAIAASAASAADGPLPTTNAPGPAASTTPGCAENPTGPWFGYFAYRASTHPSLGWAARGCFPDQATCQTWLSKVNSKAAKGTIVQNSCKQG